MNLLSRNDLVELYKEVGFDTIPIDFGKKYPPPKDWKTKDSSELWSDAPKDSNIALRLGRYGDLDSDSSKTDEFIENMLKELGIDNVPTFYARRGKHRIVIIEDAPEIVKIRHWKKEIGKGEVRVKDNYTVIPDSTVNGYKYAWIGNSYEFLRNVPRLN